MVWKMLLDGELVLRQNLGLTEFGRFGKTRIQSPNLELRTCVVLEFDQQSRGVEASYFRKNTCLSYIFVAIKHAGRHGWISLKSRKKPLAAGGYPHNTTTGSGSFLVLESLGIVLEPHLFFGKKTSEFGADPGLFCNFLFLQTMDT